MKMELTCSLAQLTCLGPDLETVKMLKECDPIGGSTLWLIKPQNNLRMAVPPTPFTCSMASPAKNLARLVATSITLLADQDKR